MQSSFNTTGLLFASMGLLLGGCSLRPQMSAKNTLITQTLSSGLQAALLKSNLVFSGPLVITHGGTYTGNYTSTDPSVPVIFVNTSEPVIIENCNLKSDGAVLISTTDVKNLNWRIDTDLIVRNCNAYGMMPTQDNVQYPAFIDSYQAKRLWVLNNYMEHTRSVHLNGYHGDGSINQSLRILSNVARDLEGRKKDGTPDQAGNFFQLTHVQNMPNVEVAWNQVINSPDTSSVGDNINFYSATGTVASPMLAHDNFVQGAYPGNAMDDAFSGTGMTTDGPQCIAANNNTSHDDCVAGTTGYLKIYRNQFVSTANAGINNVVGHHVEVFNNRTVTSGILADGRVFPHRWTGIGYSNYANMPIDAWVGNTIHDNVSAYVLPWMSGQYFQRQDIEDTCVQNHPEVCYQNTSLPNPVTLDTEKNEWKIWNQKITDNGILIGSTENGSNGVTTQGSASNYQWGAANGIASHPTPTPSLPGPPQWTRLVSEKSGLCLNILSQNSRNGTSLGQTTCGNQKSERFQFVLLSNGNYNLINQKSGLCVDIAGASTADGAKIQQWSCGSGTNQQFRLNQLSNGYSEIITVHSNSCIDVANASMNSGDPVSQWHCYGNSNQHWKLEVPIGVTGATY